MYGRTIIRNRKIKSGKKMFKTQGNKLTQGYVYFKILVVIQMTSNRHLSLGMKEFRLGKRCEQYLK